MKRFNDQMMTHGNVSGSNDTITVDGLVEILNKQPADPFANVAVYLHGIRAENGAVVPFDQRRQVIYHLCLDLRIEVYVSEYVPYDPAKVCYLLPKHKMTL